MKLVGFHKFICLTCDTVNACLFTKLNKLLLLCC